MKLKRKTKIMILIGTITAIIIFLAVIIIPTAIQLTKTAFTIPVLSRDIPVSMSDALGPNALPVSFTNSEGDTVPGWYRSGTEPAAIVLLHGLGGTRAQLAGIARHLNDNGWGVLLIDQSGHGEHSSDITTYGRKESLDALAAVEWLRNRNEIDPQRIGIYGASMGAATAIYAAAKDPDLACVIADSSYAVFEDQAYHDLTTNRAEISVPANLQPSVLKAFLVFSGTVIGKWSEYPDPVDVIKDIKCPVFLIHGECDERIESDSINQLASEGREHGVEITAWVVKDKGHCNYHGTDQFLNRISVFFHQNL